ncbi:MAG: hypothetical protein HKO57_09715, partial [Akkermansiaceae bacterium]|nr:hypothetical protein [Akkermansiaceae bacterium]
MNKNLQTRFTASLCGIAGMIGVVEAQLVDGQRIGIDFGDDNPTTNDFIEYGTPAAGVVSVTKDVTGAAVSGAVTISTSGFTGENSDATENGGEDPVFDASNLEDWIGFPASASITISGLDDALEYELVIGAGFTNQNGRTTYTADGQSISPDPQSANPFGTLSNLETDGSGNLVISLNKDVIVVTVSALTLEASTPVVISTNTWQTDGSGNWSDAGNWAPGVPDAAQNKAQFDSTLPLTGPLTATLDVPVTLGVLNLDSTHAITIAGSNTLTFNNTGTAALTASAGAHEISADVSLSGALNADLDPGTSVEVSGAVAGSNPVTVTGGGGLTLSGDLSGFTGGLIANGGNLTVASGSAATDVARLNSKGGGIVSISGTVTLASNASFGAGAGVQDTTGSVIVHSGGELNIGIGSGYTAIGGGDLAGQTSQSGNGTLTIAGGTVNVGAPGTNNNGAGGLDARMIWMNPYGPGNTASTLNLDGGVLSTQREIRDGSGGTTFVNFNGGTLQAAAATVGALFPTVDRVNVRDGGATIDTQGFDITTTKALEHSDIGGDSATDGGLTKLGSGSLTLGGANTYTGPTMVSEGTLGMTGTFTSDVSVADGATISGDGSNTTGSLTLGSTTGANLVVDTDSPTGITVEDLTLNGVTTLTVPGGAGPFAIATYSGTLTDGNGGTLEDSFAVSGGGRTPTIVDNAGTIELSVGSESTTWTGGTSGDWQIGGPDANWDTGDTFFFDGDEVTFDDSGAIKSVNIAADVAPATVAVNSSAGNDYSFSGSAITGTTGLSKDGTGDLSLLNSNTYSGATTINGGSLTVGNGGTTGTLGSGAVTNNSVLAFNRSDNIVLSNAVSGTGSLTKAGAGNLTISAAKTYTGGTTVSEGTLVFSGSGSTSTSGGILVENGGTIRFDRNDTWGAAATTSTPVITVDAGGVVQSNNKYTPLIDLVLNGGTLSANDG